jgi:uncharacterized protein YbaP (TraB family)
MHVIIKYSVNKKLLLRRINMRKVIVGFLLLIGLLSACDNSGDQKPGYTTLWEISKNGNSVFLAGSVHVLRSQDYPMPGAFDSAYNKSSMLVIETDVDRMTEPDIEEYINDKSMLPAGQTLQTVLNEDVYSRLEELIGPETIGALSQYKPSIIVNSLEISWLQLFGFTENGADLYYLAKSKQDGKSRDFLEDVKVQIDMLSDMADGIENEYVSDAIDGVPYYVSSTITLISEWKNGVAKTTEASLNVQKTQWPSIYEAMILDRNSAWIPKIEIYLTTEPIEFVIVGMAHLYGPDGLLPQLRNKGYKVKQLVN